MSIETAGPNQNSYITIQEANTILLTVQASFMPLGTNLIPDEDEPYLLEAAQDLDQLWDWTGCPTEMEQALAWPRRHVVKPGFTMPAEPGWRVPYDSEAWLRFRIDYLMAGASGIPTIPTDAVPRQIKEAQALIAVLRKNGSNLISDTQGDAQGLQLPGGLKIAYVNAIREAADIHKRTAQFGSFVGQPIVGA